MFFLCLKRILYLYANDTCIFYQLYEDVNKIENVLNSEFLSLYQWSINNKVSIYLRDDKTKVLFIHCTSFLNHHYFLDIFFKVINLVLLESHGQVECEGRKFFRKTKELRLKKNEDENCKL